MTRKLVLILALLSAVAFGFGWIQEDLCCVGGAFADDPSTPVVGAEYALPAHLQAAPKAALPAVTVTAPGKRDLRAATVVLASQDLAQGLSSLQNPRRC